MRSGVTDLTAYRKARPARVVTNDDIVHQLFNARQPEVHPSTIDYFTWIHDGRVSSTQPRYVTIAVAHLLAAFKIDPTTNVATTDRASIQVRFDRLLREQCVSGYRGLTLRDFLILTLRPLKVVLNQQPQIIIGKTNGVTSLVTYIIKK